jgi:LAO/AO transport system kinase
MGIDELVNFIKAGNKKYISRGISLIESEHIEATTLLRKIHKSIGKAYRIGITGPPGAGKSTLTNELTKLLLAGGNSVGIIAVDPTSPFTGGAVLGDRIRMNEIGMSENVYIRSMATRGSLGGLSTKTIDAADLIDAAGFDYLIFETVGVGQSELDIVKTTDSTIVVLVPESGDSVQAMKAGLMEIADFFVMNKGDRPGADSAMLSLQTILALKEHDDKTYLPKIIKSIASEGKGIDDILVELENHRKFMSETSGFHERRNTNNRIRVKGIVEKYVSDEIWNEERKKLLNTELSMITDRKLSPYDSAGNIISHYKNDILYEK